MDRMTVRVDTDPEMIEKQHQHILAEIKRGRYELRMVTNTELRNKFEAALIEDYINGALSNNGTAQLFEHQLAMLKIGERTINTIPEPLKEITKTILDHGISADTFKGGYCKGRAF